MALRKTFEGDFKMMELILGIAEREEKAEFHGEKGLAALSLMDRRKLRRRRKENDRVDRFKTHILDEVILNLLSTIRILFAIKLTLIDFQWSRVIHNFGVEVSIDINLLNSRID